MYLCFECKIMIILFTGSGIRFVLHVIGIISGCCGSCKQVNQMAPHSPLSSFYRQRQYNRNIEREREHYRLLLRLHCGRRSHALTKNHSTIAQAQRYIRPQLQFGQLRHLVVTETSMCVVVKLTFLTQDSHQIIITHY